MPQLPLLRAFARLSWTGRRSALQIGACLTSFALCFAQLLPVAAAAPTQPPTSMPAALNLGSTHNTVTAPQSTGTVYLQVGGKALKVTGGSLLTPSEAVALQQILANDDSQLRPVALVQSVLSFSDRRLEASNVLLAPSHGSMTAKAHSSVVRVSRGATAFVIDDDHSICILGLHEAKTGDITVQTGGETIILRAGEELIINSESSEVINPIPEIATRSHSIRILADGSRAYICEFSIPSAIYNLATLQRLQHSTSGWERNVYKKILKTSASLLLATSQKGPYVSR